MSIFIDSNVLIAFANEEDVLHKQAVKVLTKLHQEEDIEFFISDYVFNEVTTVLGLKKKKKQQAVQFGRGLLKSTTLLRVEPSIFKRTWELFIQHDGLSFTDTSIIACMEFYNIENLATFDSDFKKIKNIKLITS